MFKLLWIMIKIVKEVPSLLPNFIRSLHDYTTFREFVGIVFYYAGHPKSFVPDSSKELLHEMSRFLVCWWRP